MTMKLELKHLAPYLPYGLKIARLNHDNAFKRVEYSLMAINLGEVLRYRKNLKPILRPLSDLTKEIMNSNNQSFIYVESLEVGEDGDVTEFDNGNIKTIKSLISISKQGSHHDISYLPFLLVQDLIKNHFDVFGLIPLGLAIDINKINN